MKQMALDVTRRGFLTLTGAAAAMAAAGMAGCAASETPLGQTDMTPLSRDVREIVGDYMAKVDHSFSYDIAETLAYDKTYHSSPLGYRTAGSEAEHKAAAWIAEQMEALGLTEVEQVPVTVDRWEFTGASLTIKGTDIDIMPASYAATGTGPEGLTAELVDVGGGLAADYEEVDVRGKIVLAGIDQWNIALINRYTYEASLHGAAAIVTYASGGYAAYSDDMINVYDAAADDLMPNVSISRNQYRQLREALDAGHNQATLRVDSTVDVDQGTSYNVVGRILGHSSDQQIIISGHYDTYFNGFQDDSAAIGLVLGIAKAMVEAGYEPENDIVFVAHGSEEWGAVGTAFDWTTGAWEMINHAHPDWSGKTLAVLNFEMPALYDGFAQTFIKSVPEFSSLVRTVVEEGIVPAPANNVYPDGVSPESIDTICMEDGISYRMAGVPYFTNEVGASMESDGWILQRYHTHADDRDTYNADVMTTNLNMYGALAIYIDQMPALHLDLLATCDDLQEALHENVVSAAGGDVVGYQASLNRLRAAAETHNARIADVNSRYLQAVESQAPSSEVEALRSEGRALNRTTLEMFRMVQHKLTNIVYVDTVVIKHVGYQTNIEQMQGVIASLQAGVLHTDDMSGALDLAGLLNGYVERSYLMFSKEAVEELLKTMMQKTNRGNMYWGTNKTYELTRTADAIISLARKDAAGEKIFDEEIALYQQAIERQQQLLAETFDKEITAMDEIGAFLQSR